MGNHIHFYIPILAKKYNPKSKGQALKGWYLSKHIKRLCDTKPEYVLYQKIMDVDGMVYESHKFLLVKELNLGLELRVDNMLYDVSYTDFNTFKRRLIFSNPRYDFSQGDLVAFLDDAALGCPLSYDVKGVFSTRPFVDWVRVRHLLVELGCLPNAESK